MKIKKMRKKIMVYFVLIMALSQLVASQPFLFGVFVEPIKKLIIEPIYRAMFLLKLRLWITSHATSFARNIGQAITFNPTPSNNPMITNLMGTIITFIQPLYVLAILLLGFYLLFVSGSPNGRARAKAALPRVVVSMLFFSFSPQILALILTASQELTKAAFNITGTEPITQILLGGFYGAFTVISWLTMANFGLGASPWSYSMFFMAWFPNIFVAARCIVLTLLEICFPLTIMLYSFSYTRDMGRTLMEQTLVWTFMQFFWAMILVALVFVVPFKDELVVNPVIVSTNIPLLSAIPPALLWILSPLLAVFKQAFIAAGTTTDVFSLVLGITGYGMIAALPFALVGFLKGFLP